MNDECKYIVILKAHFISILKKITIKICKNLDSRFLE